jgi:hypothetical protein
VLVAETRSRIASCRHTALRGGRSAKKTLSADVFARTVLELIWLVEDALGVFGVVDLTPDERDGLRCDSAF